jgi:hypothetical protein
MRIHDFHQVGFHGFLSRRLPHAGKPFEHDKPG